MVSPDQCLAPGACLVVTVLDHDKLKRDDFEGEAFLALKDIPGVKGVKEENNIPSPPDVKPEQIRLKLMHPKPNGSIIAEHLTNARNQMHITKTINDLLTFSFQVSKLIKAELLFILFQHLMFELN